MGLTYADAALLLGGRESRVVRALDVLAGGALLTATAAGGGFALSLFDAKADLASLSNDLVSGLGDRVRGLTRFDRTERLAAAHAVVVLTAYFEELAATDLPFDPQALGLTAGAQARLAGRATGAGQPPVGDGLRMVTAALLRAEVPSPGPQQPYETTLVVLEDFYRRLSAALAAFLGGLAIWDELHETAREDCRRALGDRVPPGAVRRYEQLVRRLALDCPEVGLWLNLLDHRATRALVQRGFEDLEQTLAALASGRPPGERRLGLTRAYRAGLERPIASTGDLPDGLRLPSLADGHVTPEFRVAEVGTGERIAEESWWADQPVRGDIENFLAGYLTAPQAADAPLLILGQPGSGKSVLTRVLAGRLPAGEFLVVRVVLRDVPADTDLQAQIEYAVRAVTGENLSWPDLARSAEGALCVVILDGFDELLQTTGVSQTDYLQRVAAFQRREADQGRPVAVLVTSRTAVADRARPVPGMSAVRLEPFGLAQVAQWLEVWNELNAPGLRARGLEPLSPATVLIHRDLATQPLLLLMLTFYDADNNALRRDGATLRTAQLYERLLVRFIERELDKSAPPLQGEDRARVVEQELTRLAVVGFAMFNRGRQWVTGAELDSDLAALLPEPLVAPRTAPAGLRARLTAAEAVVGRFFFVHEAQATRDDTLLRTYEFLHATFGEYLVARLVGRELDDLIAADRLATTRRRSIPTDDALLHALLSFAPLTSRNTTTGFLADRVRELSGQDRAVLLRLVLGLFHDSQQPRREDRHRDYLPLAAPVPARCAVYALNLLLVAVCTTDKLTSDDLFPAAEDSAFAWRSLALLWRSQLTDWGQVTSAFTLDRRWNGTRRQVRVRARHTAYDDGARPLDPYWSRNFPPPRHTQPLTWNSLGFTDALTAGNSFFCTQGIDTLVHALDPLIAALGSTAISIFADTDRLRAVDEPEAPSGGPISGAHALIKLWLAHSQPGAPDELGAAYLNCAWFASGSEASQRQYRTIVLHLLAADRGRLDPDLLAVIDRELTVGP